MLNSFYRVTVPSTYEVDKPCSEQEHKSRAARVASLLSKCFGGATIVPAIGCYVADSGALVTEPVYEVTAYCSEADALKLAEHVRTFVSELCADWSQECIALTTPSGMEFVSAVPALAIA